MNLKYIFVASKDYIFLFALKDMQLVSKVKAPNHLLRIVMNPNLAKGGESADAQDNKRIAVAYSGSLDQGYISFTGVSKINTSNRSTVEYSNSSNELSPDGFS